MDYSIGKPFFLQKNGCPTSKNTHFIGIIADLYTTIDLHNDISDFIIRNSEELCKGNVSKSYVIDSIERGIILVAIFYTPQLLSLNNTNFVEILEENKSIKCFGFASCYDKNRTSDKENSLYIDVICGNPIGKISTMEHPPIGSTILNIVTEFARANNFDYVSLSALINVINYYRKFGFRHIKAGMSAENPYLTYLANLNKNIKIADSAEAEQLIKIERAYKLSFELNNKNKPELNEERFARELQKSFGLKDRLPNTDEITEYLAELDTRIINTNGEEGFYDFVTELLKQGFNNDDECRNITPRTLMSQEPNVDMLMLVLNCASEGIDMRKPLFPQTEEPDLNKPIIQCLTYGGRKKNNKSKRVKHSSKKPRSTKRRR